MDDLPVTRMTKSVLRQLVQPLQQWRTKTRTQSGKTLTYVEAYEIKAHLIRVFGFGGFSVNVLDSNIVAIREYPATPSHVYTSGDRSGEPKTPQVIAEATVMLTIFGIGPNGEDVTYTESAIGSNSGNDIGDAADNAIKTAASDALKRCATYLGTQFGLGLYNDGSLEETVKVMFDPRQQALLQEIAAEAASEQADADAAQREAAQAQLDRATGNGS